MDARARNPFLDDLFVEQASALPGVEGIHREAFRTIADAVEALAGPHRPFEPPVALGRLFLLSAPKAGYGKSHLVARIRERLRPVGLSLAMPFDRSRPATWPVALSSALRQLSSPGLRSSDEGPSPLDEFSRFFLSRLVLETLARGSMKPRDCPEDPMRLYSDFATLFSRESDSRLLPWVDKRAAELVQAADPGFSRRLGLGPAELAFWTRLFIDFNVREEGGLDRLRGLGSGEARERLLQLLRVATDLRPALVVADGLDGFHRSESAGMEVAEILNGIRERVPRTVSLLCINDDLWESAFAPRLPSAWIDRLDAESLRLHPIGVEAAKELVRYRLGRLRLHPAKARRFAESLAETRHWSESDQPITPRRILREASELWRSESAEALVGGDEVATEEASFAEPRAEGRGDREDLITLLQGSEEGGVPRTAPARTLPPQADTWRAAPPGEPFLALAPDMPAPPEAPQRVASDLAAIDSIINDIRGTGKTVVSESPERPPASLPGDAARPTHPSSEVASLPTAAEAALPSKQLIHKPVAASAPTPSLSVEPAAAASPGAAQAPASFFGAFSPSPPRPSPFGASALPLTRASFERRLAERERELLAGAGPSLDLDRLASFVRAVGGKHSALGQREERFPSSRNTCLRWSGHGHSVLVGFESPRNTYFWNNLLQQSLAASRLEKIVAFSHPSEPFDPALFAGFGFGPAVIRGRIDLIEMNDRELAMLYSAELCAREFEGTGEEEKAYQFAILRLDPLWRRIVKPL